MTMASIWVSDISFNLAAIILFSGGRMRPPLFLLPGDNIAL